MYTIGLENTVIENEKVGVKAFKLNELINSGLPVPNGFVIKSDAYDKFLRENKLEGKIRSLLNDLNVDDLAALENVSAQIRNLIIGSKMPDVVEKDIRDSYEELSLGREIKELGGAALDFVKAGRQMFVAVRSSIITDSGLSFAGQSATILNVRGIQQLMKAIFECWASLFSPKALFYKKKKRLEEPFRMGVIVQRMINADKSGVIFTFEPSTNDRNNILVEASWGLGSAVVTGIVTPDEYIINKDTGELIEKKVNKKLWYVCRDNFSERTVKEKVPNDKTNVQALNNEDLDKLWEIAKAIETKYRGQPQNIEWCEERRRIFVVQTRPINILNSPVENQSNYNYTGKSLINGYGASPGIAKGSLKIVSNISGISKINRDDIMVTKLTTPSIVLCMEKASAIITDEGGRTSHVSILSREFGIPCIVGAENATEILKEGDIVTVNAANGVVYQTQHTNNQQYDEKINENSDQDSQQKLSDFSEYSEKYNDFSATEIKLSVSFPETALNFSGQVDGIGLLKIEYILTDSRKHPLLILKNNPEELVQVIVNKIGEIAKVFYPKPIWCRSLDARSDEFRELEGGEEEPLESNPVLGWHGIRRSLAQPEIFKCEIEAIKRLHKEGLNNISLLIPFICKIDELREVKNIIKLMWFDNPNNNSEIPIKLGLMIETPAAALDIESFCKEGIDFISINYDELIQLILGADRSNEKVSSLYNDHHPAVINIIRNIITTCKKYGVKTSIAGEIANNPQMASMLVKMGIDSLSVEPDAIKEIKEAIMRTEKKILLEKLRDDYS